MAKKKKNDDTKILKAMSLFVNKCNDFVEVWGLKDWDIHYVLGNLHSEDSDAECGFNVDCRIATIRMSEDIIENTYCDNDYIERTAMHEVAHLLLADIHSMATAAHPDTVVDPVIHNIINRIVNGS